MNEWIRFATQGNRFALNAIAVKTKLLQFLKHYYDSYLTFTDYESRYMLWNSYATGAQPKYYFKNPPKIVERLYIKWNRWGGAPVNIPSNLIFHHE